MPDSDLDTLLNQYRDGLPEPGRTSTQSWGIEAWSEKWRDEEGKLAPNALTSEAAAFWFRALTEPTRLGDDREAANSAAVLRELTGPLQPEEAVRRLRDFVAAANEALTHWPRSALAPAAFPLRRALGEDVARRIIDGAVSPAARAAWIGWLGPLDEEFATDWIGDAKRPEMIEALAEASGAWDVAVRRLTEVGATDRADRLSERMNPQARAEWTLENRRPVDVDLLQAAVGTVDDDTWVRLCRKVLSRRDREIWQVLARRPRAALVSRVLDKHSGPVAGWILDWFAMGDAAVTDELIVQALGRSKRRDTALRILTELDDEEVRERIAALEEDERTKLEERLGPIRRDLPELPRSDRAAWMDTFAQRQPEPEPWLSARYLPPIETRTDHRLPDTVEEGLIATLQQVRLVTGRDGTPKDRYDAALTGITDTIEPDSVGRWWNALYGQWWSADRPDGGAWVLTAAAFLAPPSVIRDLGNSLHHYRKWFGDHAIDVLHALRVRGTAWAIAVLDDTARRGRSAELRDTAKLFLREAATRAGLTVDAYVETNLPDTTDDSLLALVAERFEDSMVEGRTWTGWGWTKRLEAAPFAEVAGTLLWALSDPDGHVLATFRYDGTAALGPDDEPFELGDDDIIALAHPAAMSDDDLRRWNELFVDYEIVQPFEQLSRERYRHASLSADGFRSPIGKTLSASSLRSAARDLGWTAIERGAHGDVVGFRRTYDRWDVAAELALSDPIPRRGSTDTRLARLGFTTVAGDPLDPAFVPAVPFSETHRDLIRLVAGN
jgi:hypothetical protein